MKTAVAAFCKTPGYSAVKTRLARDIGTPAAEECYRLCLEAVRELFLKLRQEMPALAPFWAVGEHQAAKFPLWEPFEAFWTGAGALGERLDRVYSRLLRGHRAVLLMGTDSPALTPGVIKKAADLLSDGEKRFVAGPCADGGFYLFGGTGPVPSSVWTGVQYSRPDTLEQLLGRLRTWETDIEFLPVLGDVDVAADFETAMRELIGLPESTSAQRRLLEWLASQMDEVGLNRGGSEHP